MLEVRPECLLRAGLEIDAGLFARYVSLDTEEDVRYVKIVLHKHYEACQEAHFICGRD